MTTSVAGGAASMSDTARYKPLDATKLTTKWHTTPFRVCDSLPYSSESSRATAVLQQLQQRARIVIIGHQPVVCANGAERGVSSRGLEQHVYRHSGHTALGVHR
jgi:hypothetical protein